MAQAQPLQSIADNSWPPPPVREMLHFWEMPQNLFQGLLQSFIIIIIIELATPHCITRNNAIICYGGCPCQMNNWNKFRYTLILTYCTLMYPHRPIEVEWRKTRFVSSFSNRVGCSHIFGSGDLHPTLYSVSTHSICGGTAPMSYTALSICILMIHLMRSCDQHHNKWLFRRFIRSSNINI